MRLLIAGLLLVGAGVSSAAAEVLRQPCRISTTVPEEIEVVKAVCAGNQARMEYWIKRKAEAEARENALRGSVDSDERYQLLRDWEIKAADLDDAQNRMQGKFDEAIGLTMAYYGIVPTEGEGKINGGPAIDGRAIWVPRYVGRIDRAAPILVEIELPRGGKIHAKEIPDSDEKKRAGAITWPNGRVDIYDEAMDRVLGTGSPRFLGFVLHHESVHFDQLRNGRWTSRNEREVEAYRQGRKAMGRFGLTKDERKDVEALLKENIRHVQRQYVGDEARPSNFPSPGEEAANAEAWERLESAVVAARTQRLALEKSLREEKADRAMREAVADRQRQEEDDRASEHAHRKLKEWAALACRSPDWLSRPGFDLTAVSEMFARLRVPRRPIDLSGLPFGPMGCPTFLENQLLLRRFDAGGPLPAGWLSETIDKARLFGRRLADQEARTLLQSWLQSECSGSGAPAAVTPEGIRRAYESLFVQEAVIDMWGLSYYTGIACDKLMMNLLLQERQAGRAFAGWDSWLERARVARERSRSGPPAATTPPVGGTPPPPARSGEFSGGDRTPPPDVPHCRYHPWCRG